LTKKAAIFKRSSLTRWPHTHSGLWGKTTSKKEQEASENVLRQEKIHQMMSKMMHANASPNELQGIQETDYQEKPKKKVGQSTKDE